MIKLLTIFWWIGLTLTEDTNFQQSLAQVIQDAGYTVEAHKVVTDDNYILTVFRLPSKIKNPKVVFIMHGLESSAADYVLGGKGASLSYLLADNGYDVWMGNARGNIFSQAHKKLSTKSHEFWKFSFHEIGVYDLPAMIDYALYKTNATSLSYCGYSQGTTSFLILLSMRPEYNSKFLTAYLMAPVAYMRFPTPFVRSVSAINFVGYIHAIRTYEIIPLTPEIRKMLSENCHSNTSGSTLCKSAYMFIGGESQTQYNEEMIPKVFQFFPASAGYGQFMHYLHIIRNNGRFIRFDHQREKNLELYGQEDPPLYALKNVRTKIHFLYGMNDDLANPKDVQSLLSKLRAVTVGVTKINDWNHLDFMYGKDVQKRVNNVILQKIKSRE